MSYESIGDLYIAGKRVSATESRTITHPADGSVVREVAEASGDDTIEAIRAARAAFDDAHWRSFDDEQRAKLLERTADILERDKELFAAAESGDTAKRIVESRYDIDDVISVFRHFAKLVREPRIHEVDTGRDNVHSRIVTEPVGVVAMITPWNYPLLQASWKVAPAIAAVPPSCIKPPI